MHSHLIQVDCWFTTELRLIFLFKEVTWESLCFILTAEEMLGNIFVSRKQATHTKGQF